MKNEIKGMADKLLPWAVLFVIFLAAIGVLAVIYNERINRPLQEQRQKEQSSRSTAMNPKTIKIVSEQKPEVEKKPVKLTEPKLTTEKSSPKKQIKKQEKPNKKITFKKTPKEEDLFNEDDEEIEKTEPPVKKSQITKEKTAHIQEIPHLRDIKPTKLSIAVIKTQHLMKLSDEEGNLIATFPVTIGREDNENATPPGIYSIGEIVPDPEWYPPKRVQEEEGLPPVVKPYRSYLPAKTKSENNLNALGKIWIDIHWQGNWSEDDPGWAETALGVHGTNEPDKIGGSWGHGCIRMKNEDVLALVNLINKVGKNNITLVIKTREKQKIKGV